MAHETGALLLDETLAQEWVASAPFEDDPQRRSAFYYSRLESHERDAGRWLTDQQEGAFAFKRGFRLAISGD